MNLVCASSSVCVFDVYTRPLSRTPGCSPFLCAVPRDGSRARSPTSSSRAPELSYQTRLFPPRCKIDSVESNNRVIATLSDFYTLQQNGDIKIFFLSFLGWVGGLSKYNNLISYTSSHKELLFNQSNNKSPSGKLRFYSTKLSSCGVAFYIFLCIVYWNYVAFR